MGGGGSAPQAGALRGKSQLVEGDDLYGLPLERFTQERNALTKRLRREGRREEATGVSKLRKPSAAAWAVNQLIRTQRRDVEALFRAGDALQKAQGDLLTKRGDRGSLRKAVESERAAVEHLVERARGLLSSDGHELTAARLEQVSETLHAAALDEEARARVRDGRLERELLHVGLGGLAGAPAPPIRAKPARRSSAKPLPDREAEKRRREKFSAARKAEADARRRLERAVRAVKAAEERHRRAQSDLHQAEADVASALKVSHEAARDHERAQQALDGLT